MRTRAREPFTCQCLQWAAITMDVRNSQRRQISLDAPPAWAIVGGAPRLDAGVSGSDE